MPHTSSTTAHDQFWSGRKVSSVLKDHIHAHGVLEGEIELSERARRDEEEKLQFTTDYANFLQTTQTNVSENTFSISNDLNSWAVYRSWTFCKECGSVDRIKLLPGF